MADKMEYRTPREAAEAWGVTRPTVSNWCNKGLIPAKRIGRNWKIPVETVERIAKEGFDLEKTDA